MLVWKAEGGGRMAIIIREQNSPAGLRLRYSIATHMARIKSVPLFE
jgi:hypothetical protein